MNPTPPLDESSIEARAARRVRIKMAFYMHLLVFVLVNLGLVLIWQFRHGMFGGDGSSYGGWSGWHGHGMPFPLWGWALGLCIHGIVTLLRLQGEGLRRGMLEREIEALRRREPK